MFTLVLFLFPRIGTLTFISIDCSLWSHFRPWFLGGKDFFRFRPAIVSLLPRTFLTFPPISNHKSFFSHRKCTGRRFIKSKTKGVAFLLSLTVRGRTLLEKKNTKNTEALAFINRADLVLCLLSHTRLHNGRIWKLLETGEREERREIFLAFCSVSKKAFLIW